MNITNNKLKNTITELENELFDMKKMVFQYKQDKLNLEQEIAFMKLEKEKEKFYQVCIHDNQTLELLNTFNLSFSFSTFSASNGQLFLGNDQYITVLV